MSLSQNVSTKLKKSSTFSKNVSIITSSEEFLVIEKPANLSSKTILSNLYDSLERPIIKSLDLTKPELIFTLADNIGGLLVIAKNKQSTTSLRNDYGSYKFELTFDIISSKTTINKGQNIICKLPIAKHKTKNMYLISSTTGKKTETEFIFVENLGRYEHWQAKCLYLREDQIQLHSYESGIHIIGDIKYSNCQIPSFKELNPNFKRNKKENNDSPYFGIAIYLTKIKFPNGGTIQINLPKKMSTFMKILAKA